MEIAQSNGINVGINASILANEEEKAEIHCISVSDHEQLAVGIGNSIYLFSICLRNVDETLPAMYDDMNEAVNYNPHAASKFFISYRSTIKLMYAPTAVAYRPASNKHIITHDVLISGANVLSCWTIDHVQKCYVQQWSHQNEFTSSSVASLYQPPIALSRSISTSNIFPPRASASSSHSSNNAFLRVAPDGRAVALLGAHGSASILIYNLGTAAGVGPGSSWVLDHPAPILLFHFNPTPPQKDNILMTLCSDGIVRFWRQNVVMFRTGYLLNQLRGAGIPPVISESVASSASTAATSKLSVPSSNITSSSSQNNLAGIRHSPTSSLSHSASLEALSGQSSSDVKDGSTLSRSGLTIDVEAHPTPSAGTGYGEIDISQADLEWFACCELEISGSVGQRNGFIGASWIIGAYGGTATNPGLHSCRTHDVAPRVITIDRDGTIQVWYVKDIYTNPRTNPTPIALVTLNKVVNPLDIQPWLLSRVWLLTLPSKNDTLLYDSIINTYTLTANNTVQHFSVTVKRETNEADRAREWKGTYLFIGAISGHKVVSPGSSSNITAPTGPKTKLICDIKAHSRAPYAASIGSDGRVIVWSVPDAHLIKISGSGGSDNISYLTHLAADSEYSAVAWSPVVSENSVTHCKCSVLYCAGQGFIDCYQNAATSRSWTKVARLSYPNDINTADELNAPLDLHTAPYSLSQVIVLLVTKSNVFICLSPSTFPQVSASASTSTTQRQASANTARDSSDSKSIAACESSSSDVSSIRLIRTQALNIGKPTPDGIPFVTSSTLIHAPLRFGGLDDEAKQKEAAENDISNASEVASSDCAPITNAEAVVLAYGCSDGSVIVAELPLDREGKVLNA